MVVIVDGELQGQGGGGGSSGPATEIIETSGPTTLAIGAIADGQVATRDGSTLIGTAAGGEAIASLLDLEPAALWDFRQLSDLDDGDPVSEVLDTSGNGYDATQPGVAQVETATVQETVPGALLAGNAEVIVTADGMAGSPKIIAVAVALNDTEAQVAGKIRTALGLDAAVTALFAVSGADADVVLTTIVPVTNDATLNIDVHDGTCTGLVSNTTSADTQNGASVTEASPTKQTVDGVVCGRFDPSSFPQFLSLAGLGLNLLRGVSAYTVLAVCATRGLAGGVLLHVLGGEDPTYSRSKLVVDGTSADIALDSSNDDTGAPSWYLVHSQGGSYSSPFLYTGSVALIAMADVERGVQIINSPLFPFGETVNFEGGTLGSMPDTASLYTAIGAMVDTSPFVGMEADVHLLAVFDRALSARESRLALEYCSDQFGCL